MVVRPQVWLSVDGGSAVALAPGALIGRLQSANLRVADPRVPEAAGLVSLRGRELYLLSLRNAVLVDGAPEDELLLAAGLRFSLAGAIGVEVQRVELPERVLALRMPGQVRELCSPVYSFVNVPEFDLVPGFLEEALGRVWSTAEGWMCDLGGGPVALRRGQELEVGGTKVDVTDSSVEELAVLATEARIRPLVITVRTTSAVVSSAGRTPLPVDGLPAELLTELAVAGQPISWESVAQALWGKRQGNTLRMSWDRALRRLRERLREGGVRENLVRADGKGNFELFLMPGDRIVDESAG
jgi:hypothetical protein